MEAAEGHTAGLAICWSSVYTGNLCGHGMREVSLGFSGEVI